MNTDSFNLSRFVHAQENSYDHILTELRLGRKRTHWIWYIFPQLKGLGVSANSEKYGLTGLNEARAYLADPILGSRLRECIEIMLLHQSAGAESVLGVLDALKFNSCLTLFSLAEPSEKTILKALDQFFVGERDRRTIELLKAKGEVRFDI